MHELSIAMSLVDIAETTARNAGITDAGHIEAVHLRLGVFAGVVKDALLFGYDLATAGTLLAGSRLVIEELPLIIYCPTCAAERQLDQVQLFMCPVCGKPSADIRQGKELELTFLEVKEGKDEATTA